MACGPARAGLHGVAQRVRTKGGPGHQSKLPSLPIFDAAVDQPRSAMRSTFVPQHNVQIGLTPGSAKESGKLRAVAEAWNGTGRGKGVKQALAQLVYFRPASLGCLSRTLKENGNVTTLPCSHVSAVTDGAHAPHAHRARPATCG